TLMKKGLQKIKSVFNPGDNKKHEKRSRALDQLREKHTKEMERNKALHLRRKESEENARAAESPNTRRRYGDMKSEHEDDLVEFLNLSTDDIGHLVKFRAR